MKILCLGNNTEDTDALAKKFADELGYKFHGLLSELESPLSDTDYQLPGVYHTSVCDVVYENLIKLANKFDRVVMVDQPRDSWNHPNMLYATINAMNAVSAETEFLNSKNHDTVKYFTDLVARNPSFCIYPFIELLVNYDYTTVCCRSSTPVTTMSDLKDFATDSNYQHIRQKMLDGTKIPNHCDLCYKHEQLGLISARQQETVEWANILNLKTIDDLKLITKPAYYEVRASNKCNLMCRMCEPGSSHLIHEEYQTLFPLIDYSKSRYSEVTGFNIIDFTNLKKLYISGGEPTIMPEMYDFFDKCIDSNNTEFEILINTNGTKLSEKFKRQLKNFSIVNFVFSIDGYKEVNRYIRWPSEWDNIISNWRYLVDHTHQVSVNTSISIYNISSLDRLFEYIDNNFPGTHIHCNIVMDPKLSPFNFPNAAEALSSLNKIRNMPCYNRNKEFPKTIDSLIDYFNQSHSVDTSMLLKFFEFNDKLDQSRKVNIAEYIPELDNYRSLM